MRQVTFVYSYWENPGMLREQIGVWQQYPDELKENLQIVITDDCSAKTPAASVINDLDISHKVFYIQEKVPWNWRMARNVGARHADCKWLLITDMDHVVPRETLEFVMKDGSIDDNGVYRFERVDAPDLKPYKPHNDSYFMTKERYWDIGGVDEDFAGTYGTADWPYKSYGVKIKRTQKEKRGILDRLPVALVRYPREVLPDASTPPGTLILKGQENDRLKQKIREHKAKINSPIVTFKLPYKRVI